LKSAAGAIQEGAERSGRCAARRSGRGLCEPGLGSAEATEQRAWPAAYGHSGGPQPTEDCFKSYTPNYRALQIHARDPVGVAVSALSLGSWQRTADPSCRSQWQRGVFTTAGKRGRHAVTPLLTV